MSYLDIGYDKLLRRDIFKSNSDELTDLKASRLLRALSGSSIVGGKTKSTGGRMVIDWDTGEIRVNNGSGDVSLFGYLSEDENYGVKLKNTSGDTVFSVIGDEATFLGTVEIGSVISGYVEVGGSAADVNDGTTTISGGKITASSITIDKLNFTPLSSSGDTDEIVATLNASSEGLKISTGLLEIDGSVTFSSGYDPTDKVDEVGGSYASASSGARLLVFPDANTGLQVIDDASNNVFLAYVGGASVGDVVIGNYSGGSGVLWDKSAGVMYIKGNMTAGNIDGVTITGSTFKTSSSGVRVELTANDAEIALYDGGDDKVLSIDDDGTLVKFVVSDGRYSMFDVPTGYSHIFRVNNSNKVSISTTFNLLGGDMDCNGYDINEVGDLNYACEVYEEDDFEEVIKSVQNAGGDKKDNRGWKKMDRSLVHGAVKSSWVKDLGDSVLEDRTGYSLNKLVMVQNKAITDILSRVKNLEGELYEKKQ